ncbi:TPA: hypothetical protein ACH3X3_001416 [Trebouxia sp. C0006]
MLEGGGQILRNAAALAAITAVPIKVTNIRASRSKPGLRAQHLAGLRLVAEVCQGKLTGGTIGSQQISLRPQHLTSGHHIGDTKTAGSCMLLAQAALPCLIMAQANSSPAGKMPDGQTSVVELRGGTDAAMAPPVSYTEHVLLPMLQRLQDVKASIDLQRRGFFPKGGGRLVLSAAALPQGACLPAINLTDQGQVTSIRIMAHTAGEIRAASQVISLKQWQPGCSDPAREELTVQPALGIYQKIGKVKESVGHRMVEAAQKTLKQNLKHIPIECETVAETSDTAFGDGTGIVMVAETSTGCLLGASGIGERGVQAEQIANTTADELIEAIYSGACVDQCSRQQIMQSRSHQDEINAGKSIVKEQGCQLASMDDNSKANRGRVQRDLLTPPRI